VQRSGLEGATGRLLWGRYTLCVPDVGIILLVLAGARVGKLLKTRTKRIIAFAARKTAFMQIYCMILKKKTAEKVLVCALV
jgi:uncharacterized protein YceH (UPF0502 family)